MRRPRRFRRTTGEPTIPLINVVFLMLVFFLVAGTLARPLASDLSLVRTESLDNAALPDALVLHADGRLTWRGTPATAAGYAAEAGPVARVVPDRDAGAVRLLDVAAELAAAGAERVMLVTERGLSE